MRIAISCVVLAVTICLQPSRAAAFLASPEEREALKTALKGQKEARTRLENEPLTVAPGTSDAAKIVQMLGDVRKAEADLLKSRLQLSRLALKKMRDSVRLVAFMESLVLVESGLNDSTNLWHNDDFRNGWDKFGQVSTAVGLVAGVVAPFLSEGKNGEAGARTYTLGGAMAFIGGANLLAMAFGAEKGKDIKNATVFIELTRRAYDDLKIRGELLHGFVHRNKDLEERISDIESNGCKSDATDPGRCLAEVEAVFLEFREILGQVPDYILTVDASVTRYLDFLEASGTVAKDPVKPLSAFNNSAQAACEYARKLTYPQSSEPIQAQYNDLRRVKAHAQCVDAKYREKGGIRDILDIAPDLLAAMRGYGDPKKLEIE